MAKKQTVAFFNLPPQNLLIEDELHDATKEIIRSGVVMEGPYTKRLEDWLCKRTGYRHAVLVGSGTDALTLAGMTWDYSSINLPAFTFRGTANAFLRQGVSFRFYDVEPDGSADFLKTFTAHPDDEGASEGLTVSVGMFGQAKGFRHAVDIHDGAQSWLGIRRPACPEYYPGELDTFTGGIVEGPVVTVSFDPTKNLAAMGNGGAILLYHNEYKDKWLRNLRANAVGGLNSRMSEIDAAVVLAKTKYIDEWQARRAKIAAYWIENMPSEFTPIITLDDVKPNAPHALQKFPIFIKNLDREQVIYSLEMHGIETRIHYPYMLSQEYHCTQTPDGFLSNAAVLSNRLVSLPFYPELTDGQVEHVIIALRHISRGNNT